jgi:hypothetical protein
MIHKHDSTASSTANHFQSISFYVISMEDAKLQALHDTLAQLRGKNGLGTSSQYSWQRTAAGGGAVARHPAAAALPDNMLYANFLPEGVYDPISAAVNDGDGRSIKRDFSDILPMESGTDDADRRKRTKQAKKEAAKAAKLEAKRQAKIEEKKRLKREERERKKDKAGQSARLSNETIDVVGQTKKTNGGKKQTARELAKAESQSGTTSGVAVEVRKRQSVALSTISDESTTQTKKVKVDKKRKAGQLSRESESDNGAVVVVKKSKAQLSGDRKPQDEQERPTNVERSDSEAKKATKKKKKAKG